MLKYVNSRMGIRVALKVSCFLIIMIAAGVGYVYRVQTDIIYGQMIEEGRILSMVGAKSVAAVMEEAVDNKVISIDALFDKQYEIISGFSPPKYHTKYDAYLDRAILKLQDEFLENPTVLYAMALDVNGYVPTHNSRYQQPISGDENKDFVGNRTKRIFTDEYSIKAARSQEKGLVQHDNHKNDVVVDISSPIFVKSRHWGCFKIGLTPASMLTLKKPLLKALTIGGVVFLIFSVLVIFLIVNRSLKPLVTFSKMASDLADGDVDQKIIFKRKDEIGKVAEALERLRISLKAAIERLMRR